MQITAEICRKFYVSRSRISSCTTRTWNQKNRDKLNVWDDWDDAAALTEQAIAQQGA